jgi:hypothetical protein
MDHLDVLTAFLNPEIDDDDIYMTLPEGWPEGLNAPKIIVKLRKALYGLKQAPQLCVRARMPAFGLIGIRMVIIGIQLQTWMRVIVDVDVSR